MQIGNDYANPVHVRENETRVKRQNHKVVEQLAHEICISLIIKDVVESLIKMEAESNEDITIAPSSTRLWDEREVLQGLFYRTLVETT